MDNKQQALRQAILKLPSSLHPYTEANHAAGYRRACEAAAKLVSNGIAGDAAAPCLTCAANHYCPEHNPAPESVREQAVAWRFKLKGESEAAWIATTSDTPTKATEFYDVEPLYASPLPAVQTVAFKANRPVTPMVKDAATVARHPELQAIYTIPLVEAVR